MGAEMQCPYCKTKLSEPTDIAELKLKMSEMKAAHKIIMRALWTQKTIAPATSPELVEATRVMMRCEKQLEEVIKEKEHEKYDLNGDISGVPV